MAFASGRSRKATNTTARFGDRRARPATLIVVFPNAIVLFANRIDAFAAPGVAPRIGADFREIVGELGTPRLLRSTTSPERSTECYADQGSLLIACRAFPPPLVLQLRA